MRSLSYICLLFSVSYLLMALFDDRYKVFQSCFVKHFVNQRILLHVKRTFSPKSFRWFRHQKVENQMIYTRTANEEKMYIKKQVNIKYFIRKYQKSYLNKVNSQNCTWYRNNPHEQLATLNRTVTYCYTNTEKLSSWDSRAICRPMVNPIYV